MPWFWWVLGACVLAILGLAIYAVVRVSKSPASRRGLAGRPGPPGTAGATGGQGQTTVLDVTGDTVLTTGSGATIVRVDASANVPVTITLPPLAGVLPGQRYTIVIVQPGTADVSVLHAPDLAVGLVTFDVIQTSNQAVANTNPKAFVGGLQTAGDYMIFTSDTLTWQLYTLGQLNGSIAF